MFHASSVIDLYNEMRKEIQRVKFDAMVAKLDVVEAQQNYINSL